MNRRYFLQFSSAALATIGGWPIRISNAFSTVVENAAALVKGKDSRLVVHSGQPLEIETPIELLRQHAITPNSLLFIRNNQRLDGTSTIESMNDPNWVVEFDGLVEFPRSITVAELQKMEQVEQTIVLQCSGNGRAFFSEAAEAAGSQWRNGAMGNVKFKGVPLKAVLDHLKANVSDSARFVCAEGKDSPLKSGAADFEHSIPLQAALERSLLALELNGVPIPAVHGGPCRLVTPGFYGTMNVKWLSRLRFESEETANHHQVKRYRTPITPIKPGEKFDYGLENSEANWDMRIKSVIFAPLEGEGIAAGKTKIEGVAWNDGRAPITAVEVSVDGGRKWEQATVKKPDSPYAWYPWSISLELNRGTHSISSRAVDALGRTQPMDGSIHWNPAGYAFNGVQTIRVKAT